jgi:polyhydroxyalkanoate synthesis regulator phasin
VTRALSAKGVLDRSLRGALSAMNLPSTADVEALKGKIEDLEQLLAQLEAKVDRLLDPVR